MWMAALPVAYFGGAGTSAGGGGAGALVATRVKVTRTVAASQVNQVKIGGTGSLVTVGDIVASTAAQTGVTSLVTVDASGTLGRDTTTLSQFGSSIGSLQSGLAAQGASIATLQSGQTTLFNLSEINRRDIQKANEGVAMALALDSPSLEAGTNFAVSGGVGYYQNRTAVTTAFTARIGAKSSFSAGAGIGLNTGELGARGGFQIGW